MRAGANDSAPRRSLLPLQLLVAAVAICPLGFLCLLIVFSFGPEAGVPFLGEFMTKSAAVVAAVVLIVNLGLSVILFRAAHRSDSGRGSALFAFRTLVGAVLFTFAAFFAATAMMLEQAMAALLLAIGMILGIMSRFPLRILAERWVP